MHLLFWLSLILLLTPHTLYPALLYLGGLVRGRLPQRAEIEPRVSLIISAYNEQAVIGEKLENSLSLEYPPEKLEIIVASESTDRTNELVAGYASRGVRLLAYAGRKGKGPTLYASVPQAQGEIIVFSDANGFYRPDAIRKLVRNFADARIGCVSGRLEYRSGDSGDERSSESTYWRLEIGKKLLESRLFSLLGSNGSIFAVRKQCYFPLNELRGDDFELTVMALLHGYAAVLDPEAVSYEEASEDSSGQFKRRVRIVSWNFASASLLLAKALRARRWLVAGQLLARLLRWCGPLALLVLFLANLGMLGSAFFESLLAGQIAFYGLALAGYLLEGRRAPKLMRLPYSFCSNNVAMLWGVMRSLQTRPTWERAR